MWKVTTFLGPNPSFRAALWASRYFLTADGGKLPPLALRITSEHRNMQPYAEVCRPPESYSGDLQTTSSAECFREKAVYRLMKGGYTELNIARPCQDIFWGNLYGFVR